MGQEEILFINAIFESSRYHEGVSYPFGHFAENRTRILQFVSELDLTGGSLSGFEARKQAWNKFLKIVDLQYGKIMHGTVLHYGDISYFYNEINPKKNISITIDILERERLAKRNILEFESNGVQGSVSYVDLTYLAIDLIRTCTRRGPGFEPRPTNNRTRTEV
ncbi:MAG TPA: hypothetical protein VF744_00370 [Beijerinckiaceae bacterium]|jgi:hypothetical protein